jgi:hypothetical protein
MNAYTLTTSLRTAEADRSTPSILAAFVSSRISEFRSINQEALDCRRYALRAQKKLRAYRVLLRRIDTEIRLQPALLESYSFLLHRGVENASGIIEFLFLHPALSADAPKGAMRYYRKLSRKLALLSRAVCNYKQELDDTLNHIQERCALFQASFTEAGNTLPWRPNLERLANGVETLEEWIEALDASGHELLEWHSAIEPGWNMLGVNIMELHTQLCRLEEAAGDSENPELN